jgi:glycosyltransferase involved in cell wall biosynthesis
MRGLKQYSFKLLEKYLVDKVDLICVVNCSIGNWYQLKYPQKWIHVQYNYPDLRYSQDNQFVPNLRQSLLIPHESIIVLYQGVLAPNRGLEILIEAAAQLSKTEFTFVIIGKGLLKCELQESSPSNVHFLDFVKPASILSLTRQADVGICLISGESSLSYKLSSPNKIFEYLVSNLYIIASNLPEISKVLSGNDYCSILDELKADTLAEALRSAKQSLKVRRANKLTKKTFLWQSTEMQLVECYRKLLTHP